jgi:hypothetical protein
MVAIPESILIASALMYNFLDIGRGFSFRYCSKKVVLPAPLAPMMPVC